MDSFSKVPSGPSWAPSLSALVSGLLGIFHAIPGAVSSLPVQVDAPPLVVPKQPACPCSLFFLKLLLAPPDRLRRFSRPFTPARVAEFRFLTRPTRFSFGGDGPPQEGDRVTPGPERLCLGEWGFNSPIFSPGGNLRGLSGEEVRARSDRSFPP